MVEKQKAGFKFGKYRLKVIETKGEVVSPDGRKYRLVMVETNEQQFYYALRLYNAKGKFIKQFLYEPAIAGAIAGLLGMVN